MPAFRYRVFAEVAKIPKGRVSTYGKIAYMIGAGYASRAVGNALNKNIYADVPCHRVVRANGEVGGYAWGSPNKISRLRREGVVIVHHRIDLKQYGI